MSEPQWISDISTAEARKAHAKMVLEQLLEKFESVEMLEYKFSNIGVQLYVTFKFRINEHTVDLAIHI